MHCTAKPTSRGIKGINLEGNSWVCACGVHVKGGGRGLTRYFVLSTEFKKLSVSPESFALTKE